MGHGWITPNPDGSKARCMGPPHCPGCREESNRMSVVSENVGGPDAPELDARCRFCRRPLVPGHLIIAVKGNYCLDCNRDAFRATGCGVAGLGRAANPGKS